MISILVVTRNRVKNLRMFLDSIQETCSDIDHIEVLLRVDDDDTETIEFIENYCKYSNTLIKSVIGKRGKGYAEMDKMVKEICRISKGKIIYLLNDDAQFVSKDWDNKILDTYNNVYSDNIYTIRTSHNQPENPENPLFPIITRDWYDVLDNFASCLETDTALYFLNKLVKREIFIEDIKVNHNHPDYSTGLRDGKVDTTYAEGRMAIDSGKIQSDRVRVFSPQGYTNIVSDAIKLCSRIISLQNQKRTIKCPLKIASLYWKYLFRLKLYYYIYLPRIHYAIKYYNHYFLGSSIFCNVDFKDQTKLAIKLRIAQDPVSQYLFQHFSTETKQLIDKFDGTTPISKALQKALVDELNRALQDDFLYDENRFENVTLKPTEIHELITQNPKGKHLIRLNRLLLEETYPHEIVKSYLFKFIWK
jgi:hypothetical protein